jgi:hypothetical protein
MSNLFAKIHTDKHVCGWLQEYVDNGEVKINKRSDGGLDIDVTYRTAFSNVNDYSRVKNYLRKNGFTSRVGIHSREMVDVEIPSSQFSVTYLIAESTLNGLTNKINDIINMYNNEN